MSGEDRGRRGRRTVDCPVCGEREVRTLYFNEWDECVGCSSCIFEMTDDEYLDRTEFDEIMREVRLMIEEEDGAE